MKTNSKVRFITLGCKVNQYETQGMREAVERSGMQAAGRGEEEVNFVVINTCTVTEEADKENRYWIRRAKREHPEARIVVTGCGVVKDRAAIEALPEVDLVLAQHEKAEIANRLSPGCGAPAHQEFSLTERETRHRFIPLTISQTEGAGRAFVKIQDGCNHACSFCKVVMVRGRSRSRNLADILDEIKRLRDSGYKEIVFAGIQLGAYGLDFETSGRLVEVLEESAKIEGIERLRLSSIEPTDVAPELITALASIPKCCPQLHIPLQSGDSEILKRMNRRYERGFYIDLVKRLKAAIPDFCLTLDVMVGFPGEEEAHFQNTIDLLREVRPLKCHVFPYSRRAGTRAAAFDDIDDAVMRERVTRLIGFGETFAAAEREKYTGRKMDVLAEYQKKGTPLLQGFTANYLKVYFQGEPSRVGQMVPVELLAAQGDGFLGRAVHK